MEEEFKYLVFRVYSEKERPNLSERMIFYGWTNSKSIIKAFLKQRDERKYKVIKMTDEEIIRQINYSDEIITPYTFIDFIKLKSVNNDNEITLFTTLSEKNEVEKRIQKMFNELSSIKSIHGRGNYVDMILNLDEYYLMPLLILGYRQEEIYLFEDDSEERSKSIERYRKNLEIIEIDDTFAKIIYSIESFIKILKNDL